MLPDPLLIERDLSVDEGVKLSAYPDTKGLLTIGIGHCLDTNPLTADQIDCIGHDGRSAPITKQQAYWLLDQDLNHVYNTLDNTIPWWISLNEVRARVVAELCFNMGWGNGQHGLSSFKHTLEYLRTGQWNGASAGLLASKWAKDVGNGRSGRLARMIATGIDIIPGR